MATGTLPEPSSRTDQHSVIASKYPSIFVTPIILWLVGAGMLLGLLTAHATLTLTCLYLLGVSALAKFWSHYSLHQVSSALELDKLRAFPDERIAVSVRLQNNKLLPVWLELELPLPAALRTPAGAATLSSSSGLLAYQSVQFEQPLTALRRGVHRLGPAQLTAGDPLGFYRKTKLAAAAELIVYPRLIALSPLALPRRDHHGRVASKGLLEDPLLVNGVREYQHGRPARYMHWKASARQRRLVQKLCEATEREKVLIAVRSDGFAYDASGDTLDRCLEVAASLATRLHAQGCAVGFASNGRLDGGGAAVMKLSSSHSQLAQLFESMARLLPEPSGALLDSLRTAGVLAPSVSVVLFSYALDADTALLQAYLAQRRIPCLLVACATHLSAASAQLAGPNVQRLAQLRLPLAVEPRSEVPA